MGCANSGAGMGDIDDSNAVLGNTEPDSNEENDEFLKK